MIQSAEAYTRNVLAKAMFLSKITPRLRHEVEGLTEVSPIFTEQLNVAEVFLEDTKRNSVLSLLSLSLFLTIYDLISDKHFIIASKAL